MALRASAADGFVARWWRGEAGLAGALASGAALPLRAAYAAAASVRSAAYDRRILPTYHAGISVLSVGNLTVGGTGKTPFARWVVDHLLEAGRRPALVSGGYGADEPALHTRWNPDAPVICGRDRRAAVERAHASGADVAVLDDGFQHRGLARDLDMVLVAERQGARARHLPAGPFREGFRALRRADLVILTGHGASAAPQGREGRPPAPSRVAEKVRAVRPDLPEMRVRFLPDGWLTLEGLPTDPPAGTDLLGVTSVADPDPFGPMVGALTGADIEVLAFADHHDYSQADVRAIAERAAGRPIVTTEKDSVKLAGFSHALPSARVLALHLRWDAGEALVRARIRDALDSHG